MTLALRPPASGDLAAASAAIRSRLRDQLGESVYNSWFTRLSLDRCDKGVAILSLPTKFLRNWIEEHHLKSVRAAVATELPDLVDVKLTVRSVTPQRAPACVLVKTEAAPPAAAGMPAQASTPEIWSPLDGRFTFARFLVGPGNAVARAAAADIADITGRSGPALYLYGDVGVGKTHLLHAIASRTVARGLRAGYMTAERFMFGFAAAQKADRGDAFRRQIRGVDVLILDDIQFLRGVAIQQQLCEAIALLDAEGRRLVIAADRPPVDLDSLDARLRSRLSAGLVVGIQAPDGLLRVELLRARIAAMQATSPWFDVPDDVVAYVASEIRTNARDLEGAVNRIFAEASLTRQPPTIAGTAIAIRDLVQARAPKPVRLEEIQRIVCSHYGIARGDMLSARRTASVVRPRQVAMYLSKKLTLKSLPEIGRRFGNRDHTTALHATRKIERLIADDAVLADEITTLRSLLEARS